MSGLVTRTARVLLRRGTREQWEEADPILLHGEPGLQDHPQRVKVGDGIQRWTDLPWLGEDVAAEVVARHGADSPAHDATQISHRGPGAAPTVAASLDHLEQRSRPVDAPFSLFETFDPAERSQHFEDFVLAGDQDPIGWVRRVVGPTAAVGPVVRSGGVVALAAGGAGAGSAVLSTEQSLWAMAGEVRSTWRVRRPSPPSASADGGRAWWGWGTGDGPRVVAVVDQHAGGLQLLTADADGETATPATCPFPGDAWVAVSLVVDGDQHGRARAVHLLLGDETVATSTTHVPDGLALPAVAGVEAGVADPAVELWLDWVVLEHWRER